ncbi:MAG: hypothetical protein QOJ85_3177, partial [Solirubrobacteraceae bacterium]|nr:hypothetical protein [Solirubrobacteraceae bacterium]
GRRRLGPAGRRLGIAGIAALGAFALAGPAQGALSSTGTIDPVNGFPAWYEDADGTRLALCIDDPGCPSTQGAGVASFTAPDGERFYQLASATATGANGQSATVDFNVEAAFLGRTAADGITFGRIQVTLRDLQASSDYTITHPYGVGVWTTDANGDLLKGDRAAARDQVGCGNTPCDFDIALRTPIGPFLTWDPAESAPPAGYIGDGTTPHTVLGSPTGDNLIRVEGPGLPAGGITSNLFTVEGKLASDPAPIFFSAPGSGAFGTVRVDSTSARQVVIKNNGLAGMDLGDVTISGANANEFVTETNTCANATIASGHTCTVPVRFTPAATGARTANLVVAQSGAADHTIALTGTGGVPGIETSPGIVNFLNQTISTTSGEQVLTVSNTGPVSVTVRDARISGRSADEFAIATNACASPIGPGNACKIGLRFLPAAAGVRNATLTLTSDAPGSPHVVELTGNGTVLPGPGTAGAGDPGAGAPGAGAGTVAGNTASSASVKPLVLKRLVMAKRIRRSTARTQGIRLHMELTPGTEIVKINVYRRRAGRLTLISSGFKTPGRIGVYNVRQNHAALRRLLRAGIYEVHVTPGASRTGLGTPSKRAFTVV